MKLRIIKDNAHSAAFNMAADLYAMKQCELTNAIYVRFYTWVLPSITIGYSQKASSLLNLESCDNVAWIRRPTGGRAVLHWEDVTYSCIFPRRAEFMGATIAESYRIISQCLAAGLLKAGIDCGAHDSFDQLKDVRREVKLPCFLAPNREELMIDGKKLVGSAQKRTEHAVLQHGSIPISKSYRDLPFYLNITNQEKDSYLKLLEKKSICIDEIKPGLESDTIVSCLTRGFTEKLPYQTAIQNWNEPELIEIEQLAESEEFQRLWLHD